MFDQFDVQFMNGLLVTTPARTILDLAITVPTWHTTARILAARQRQLLTVEECADQAARREGLRGRRRFLDAAAEVAGDGSDSILERRVRELLRTHGLRPSAAPVRVRCRGRDLNVDIALAGSRVAVECDGWIHHRTRSAFERDRARWRQLREAGWTIIWATWERVHTQPLELVEEVRRALAA